MFWKGDIGSSCLCKLGFLPPVFLWYENRKGLQLLITGAPPKASNHHCAACKPASFPFWGLAG